jgi:hypothetical protein
VIESKIIYDGKYMRSIKKLTYIIKTNNEEHRIREFLAENAEHTVLLVDSSNDNTRLIAREYPETKIIIKEKLENSVKTAINNASTRYTVYYDSLDDVIPEKRIRANIDYMKYKKWDNISLEGNNTIENVGKFDYNKSIIYNTKELKKITWRSKKNILIKH